MKIQLTTIGYLDFNTGKVYEQKSDWQIAVDKSTQKKAFKDSIKMIEYLMYSIKLELRIEKLKKLLKKGFSYAVNKAKLTAKRLLKTFNINTPKRLRNGI